MPRPTPATLVACLLTGLALSSPAFAYAGSSPSGGGAAGDHRVSFELDVQPILAAFGCSVGECHGKQRGQNGFQLSLLGFDPEFDYDALTRQGRGRRIFPAAPDQSLLLLKAAAVEPHGGGRRFDVGSDEYQTLRRWIADGAPRRIPGEPKLDRVTIEPTRLLMQPGDTQPITVTAHYSDGTSRDVTRRTAFQSNEAPIVAVSNDGVMKAGPIPGEAAIMVRYSDQIEVCNVAIPLPGADQVPAELYEQLPVNNFIDEHVWAKLRSLGITPSPPAGDEKFLRRVYLDIIGRLPTADETRTFLDSTASHKREQLVDDLLARPEYADHWANKWADLLRPNPYRVGVKAVFTFDNWIRDSFRQNKPHDQFARELVAASGSTWRNGAVVMLRDKREPDELTTMVSQLFLGIRLECAKCHQHPFEVWSQDDFYSFAAYFAKLGRKGTGLSPPISGGEEIFFARDRGEVTHPLTGATMQPRPLFGEAPPADATNDARDALATWITSDDNPYFAKVSVNRVWADMMGRGIVEPVDDLRATNPPSNGPLLDALAKHFREHGYDFKALIRVIALSHVYGLDSQPTERNIADTRNYSRRYRQRLGAEVLLDAVSDITGVPEDFAAMPPGSRAMQLWTYRVNSVFLDTFGRPNENQDPPCERTPDSTVTQALHMMNGPRVYAKITSDKGLAAQLTSGDDALEPAAIIERLYLTLYNRYPTTQEQQYATSLFAREGTTARQTTQDLMWAMLNTPEFVFKD